MVACYRDKIGATHRGSARPGRAEEGPPPGDAESDGVRENSYPIQLPASDFAFPDASGKPLTGPITVAPGESVTFQVTLDYTRVPNDSSIVENYCAAIALINPSGRVPTFLSIDTEGLDLSILKTLDFTRFRPKILCVETLVSSTNRTIPEIPAFLATVGYVPRGGSMVNTLFVDSKIL